MILRFIVVGRSDIMAKRFAKFTDEELKRLQEYIDYDDDMYKEIQEEFKERKYRKEMYDNLDKGIELSK